MLREFRDFITRGNIVDLAVAVVLGIAFGAIISALFLAIAAAVFFLVVKPLNALASLRGGDADEDEPSETELLTDIRDLLRSRAE